MRPLYAIAVAYFALCVGTATVNLLASPAPLLRHGAAPAVAATQGKSWFVQQKPYCNPVEVETRLRTHPAPDTPDGAAHAAACLALAGKLERAAATIESLPAAERRTAASVVFQIAHPVADAGDDESAGPIMSMVLRFTPNNYMALYHAGMSMHILGETEQARRHLERFLEIYGQQDGWRRAAQRVLAEIGA